MSVPPESESTRLLDIPHLNIRWPDGREERFTLRDLTRIGRRVGQNDITVPSEFKTISGTHAEIRATSGGFEIIDLNSSNGTHVNGRRISAATLLTNGDDIRVGNESVGQAVHLTIHTGDMAPTGARPKVVPAAISAPDYPIDQPYLVTRWPSGEEIVFAIEKDIVLLGRASQADVIFPQTIRFVSNRHAEIHRAATGFTIVDLGSLNGTYVNNRRLNPAEPASLHHGAVIRIGDDDFGASIGLTFHDPTEVSPDYRGYTSLGSVSDLSMAEMIVIGRDPACGIVLDAPNVSRKHAAIRPHEGTHIISDLDSSNGTYVNGQPVKQTVLNAGDVVQIGTYVLAYDGQKLSRFDNQGMRMDVKDVYKAVSTAKGKIRILDDISLTVMPREFVALVGGSGAGKSTLLDALNGFRPAKGTVMLNGHHLYKEYDSFRTQFGYVPQHDILHASLTVERALSYAARLRLPGDVTSAERKKRIAQVLETVGMNEDKIRRTRISSLSGGQRKRVSIAAELLAEPKLFFLDEPTSGLDPGLEKKMMYTMRRMADEGRTVILITHATSNIVQVDHVAFLSQGRLVYFGPPQNALDFFEVDDFADIYEKIERNGKEWHDVFHNQKSEYFQQYVVERQQTSQGLMPGIPKKVGAEPFQALGSMARQFNVFSQRMSSILLSERLSLMVLLAIMPIIAIFLMLVAQPDVLVGRQDVLRDVGKAAQTMTKAYMPTVDAQTILFSMSLAAVLIGLFTASNELVNERPVYLRERMINLKLIPYIASKLFVCSILALIQCALLMMFLGAKINFPSEGVLLPSPLGPFELYITLFLATMASVAMGLLISAISSSTNMVSYLILIVLFVQIIFAGSIFDLRDNPVEPVSYLTVTHWSLVGLGTTSDVNGLAKHTVGCGNKMELDKDSIEVDFVEGVPEVNTDNVRMIETDEKECRSAPMDKEDISVAYGEGFFSLMGVWAILIFFGAAFTGATLIALKRYDKM
ncbi:MAG: FHA domain-containing protein [Anaerolineae bacterium]|nr:FHA domain-containing protein [Anaerolineae bacterium]